MIIVGIDEVGRGCWAGPVVAGAVVLAAPIPGLKDSKKLTRLQRQKLAAVVKAQARAYGLGWVEPKEVDRLGLTEAVRLAMRRALAGIGVAHDEVIIDGNLNYLPDNPKSQAVIKADDTVPAVSAASILAKVTRDEYMLKLSVRYPEYGFDRHAGYGTKLHFEMLQRHGVSDQHRLTYKPVAALLK